MKYLRSGISVAILCGICSLAHAGDKIGGGGAAVVCKNTAGQISSVKLLDLYQAELERSLKIPRSTRPKDTQIAKALSKLNKYLAFDVKDVISKIKVDYLPANITMSQKYDLGDSPVQIEDNCFPEWVAYYGADDHLKIVTKYYNKMSVTDQAALFVHEGVYKIARDGEDKDSSRTRQIVGMIFSTAPNQYELEEIATPLVMNRDCSGGLSKQCGPINRFIEVTQFPTTSLYLKLSGAGIHHLAGQIECTASDGKTSWSQASSGGVAATISLTGDCRYVTLRIWSELTNWSLEVNGVQVDQGNSLTDNDYGLNGRTDKVYPNLSTLN